MLCRLLISFVLLLHSHSSWADSISFSRDIAPMLVEQCQNCHGPTRERGRYRVDQFSRLMTPGASDLPTIVPHSIEASELFTRLITSDADQRMPADSEPLPEESIALFRQWIEDGAHFDADDPDADLLSIVPSADHPSAPLSYPRPIPVTALSFNHKGDELLVGGYHEILSWNIKDSPILTRRITNQGERTYALSLHPHGRWLASASGAPGRIGEVRLFDIFTGEMLDVIEKTPDVSLAAAFSPDGSHLATGSSDGSIRIYEPPTFKQTALIAGHSNWVQSIAWNAEGTRLASASRDKTAKVFSLEGDRLITFPGHAAAVQTVAFHPGGDELISAAADRKLIHWRLDDAQSVKGPTNYPGEITAMFADENFIFLSGSDGKARQYGREDRELIREFTHMGKGAVLSLAFDSDHSLLAMGGFDGRITLWHIDEQEPHASFTAFPMP